MKEPWEWEENDLIQLVDLETEESLTLDYKASDALQKDDEKKDEISRDVSAMANAAGGVLIYGIKENKGSVPPYKAGYIDAGIEPNEISKEWLEQVINSRIQRKIDGIRIKPVDLKTKAPGKVAYVVYIPQSFRAPHQASDKKFYKRCNFQRPPMEEYEIRDIMRRSESPDLKMSLYLQNHKLVVSISNDSFEPANSAVIIIDIDSQLQVAVGGDWKQPSVVSYDTKSHGIHRFNRIQLNWTYPNKQAIFKGLLFAVGDINLTIPTSSSNNIKDYIIGWFVGAPRMIPRQQFQTLRVELNGQVALVNDTPIVNISDG